LLQLPRKSAAHRKKSLRHAQVPPSHHLRRRMLPDPPSTGNESLRCDRKEEYLAVKPAPWSRQSRSCPPVLLQRGVHARFDKSSRRRQCLWDADTSQQVSRLPFGTPFLDEICRNARFILSQDR